MIEIRDKEMTPGEVATVMKRNGTWRVTRGGAGRDSKSSVGTMGSSGSSRDGIPSGWASKTAYADEVADAGSNYVTLSDDALSMLVRARATAMRGGASCLVRAS